MLGATLGINQYVQRLQSELERVDKQEIQTWADLIYEAWENEQVRLRLRQRRLGHHGLAHLRGPGQELAPPGRPERRIARSGSRS